MLHRRTFLKSSALLTLPCSVYAQKVESENHSLIQKVIPSTGHSLPVVGIGTNHYGHGIGEGQDEELMAPLREVLAYYAQMGGGLIDTSVRYGESEAVLGTLIEELKLNQQFFISTKVFSDDVDEAVAQMAQSAQRLNSGSLDLVSVHNLRAWQSNLPMLQEAKKEGTIRYCGITTAEFEHYEELAQIMETETLDFVQVNYSLRDRTSEDRLLKIAADKGIAVVVNRAFNEGELFADVKDHDLPDWAAEFDASSWGQLFLKYVVSHPAVTSVIPGTTKLRHLIDNLGAAQGRLPTQEQRREIENYYTRLIA